MNVKETVWRGLSFIKLWAILTLLCCITCSLGAFHMGTKREVITVIKKVSPEKCTHNFVMIEDYVIKKEQWFYTDNHVRIPGSEHNRSTIVAIWECSKCGGLGATRYLTNPIENKDELSVEYARSEIARAKAEQKEKKDE